MFESDAFAGTRVLITGGGTGIGRRLAETFSDYGATVGIAARREAPLKETCDAIETQGGSAEWKTLDVRDEDRVETVVGEFWDDWGGIDVLVNNAGANFISPALGISANGWRTVLDINLTGCFLMSKAVGRRMISEGRGGRIVNMSATNARGGSPMIAHSGASKAGINSLTESLAVEWGGAGVTVNAILPGPVRTEGSDERLWTDEDLVDSMEARIPLGRFGRPDDIAPLVLFLASDAAGFITGALIPCDGGDALRSPQFGGS